MKLGGGGYSPVFGVAQKGEAARFPHSFSSEWL